MKGLKKLALVSAISAASFAAQAELKSLDDATMGTLTGQAGVTIELETQVSIGEFSYTDEGTFAVKNINIGGAAPGSLLDDLKITVDIAADGDAIIDIKSVSGAPVDFGVSFAEAELRGTAGEQTTLMSNFSMVGALGGVNMTVDTGTDTLIATVLFAVSDLDVDVDFLAVGIKDLTIKGANSDGSMPAISTGSPAYDQFARAKMTMGASAAGDALVVTVDTFAADINIGAVEIGGTSIGSVAMNDLVVSNTSMKIYGH